MPDGQVPLALRLDEPLAPGKPLSALDLFSGIGGLSIGFRENGFSMTGVDSEPVAKAVYEGSGIGTCVTADLVSRNYESEALVVLGGPPCRPWSAVNQQKRRAEHADHGLFDRFIDNVLSVAPTLLVMENVPALGSDPTYAVGLDRLRGSGYDVAKSILRYDRFGASTRRQRLFTVAVRGPRESAHRFFELLRLEQQPAGTVRDAIYWLRDTEQGGQPDHLWSDLKSIGNYRHLYESGKYGWMKLRYDEAAPSFGSVSKTYILHPEAGDGDFPERVVSVREVLSIMGFASTTAFPDNTPKAKRYQMAANAVAPSVSRAIARVAKYMLMGELALTTGGSSVVSNAAVG